jgi:aminodeoxyfutalosine deaminase
MFRQATGSLFGFLKSIGRKLDDCGAQTPLSRFLRNQAVDEHWIITHLNELAEEDFDLLARVKKFHVAHCPRSHTFFGHSHFELRKLQSLGFNVCLGTDSLASNSSLNLFAEMRELIRKEPWILPRQVLAMITINAAKAIGRADSLGKISPGFYADLIGIPCGPTGKDVFEEIVQFEGTVPWMMVNGVELTHR